MLQIIKNCPVCNHTLTRVNDQLYCYNTDCSAIANKKIIHFAKVAKIKGLGEKTIDRLGITSINDIFSLSEEYLIEHLGEKVGKKIFTEISKVKSNGLEFSTLLYALSIPSIGQGTARKIAEEVDSFENMDISKLSIGNNAKEKLSEWVGKNNYNMPFPIKNDKSEIQAKVSVCISGRVPNYTKATLAELLKEKGVDVKSTVTKTVNYLICEDRKGSAKEKKAEQLNIPILGLNEFLNTLGENND